MIRAFIVAIVCLFGMENFAQNSPEQKEQMRQLFREEHPDLEMGLNQTFQYADSLNSSGSAMWVQKLDSLKMDSIHGVAYELPVEFEKYFYYTNVGKTGLAQNALKRCQSFVDRENASGKLYEKINTYLASEFEKSGDFSFAVVALQRLLASSRNNLENTQQHFTMRTDSLNAEIALTKSASEKKIAEEVKMRKTLLQALAAAGFLLIMMITAFFIFRSSAKKKMKALLDKQNDTSELDSLASKLEVLKNEAQQFKHTAQLTVNKLNGMDVSNRKATLELAALQNDILKALEELRQQCEQNKASISPPVFMAIQNVSTRLGNSSVDKIQSIGELLK